jgi:pyochelin synthetase
MTVSEALHMLQARDIQLMVEGDQLRYDAPEGAITDEVLTLLRQHKAALLALLAPSTPAKDAAARAPCTPGACTPPAPLTPWYPCVVCGSTDRWDDHGIWRCIACWPP